MKTIDISVEEMKKRCASFGDLQPYQQQLDGKVGLPAELTARLAAENVYPIMVPVAYRGRSQNAPIKGEPGLIIAIAECSPGRGPVLHCHEKTTENFLVLEGEFEVVWGDSGENALRLKPLDFISVPAGVCRTFRNVSDQKGRMLAMLQSQGPDHDDPVSMPPSIKQGVIAEYGMEPVKILESLGMRFDAGIDAPR